MRKLKIYLDNCCFNRPYDDQKHLKIELETKAKLFIQSLVTKKEIDLVWSYMLDYENSKNISKQKSEAIQRWQKLAIEDVDFNSEINQMSNEIQKNGIKNADAIHVACAIYAKCDYFISVDKRLLKYPTNEIIICDPIEFLRVWEVEDNE